MVAEEFIQAKHKNWDRLSFLIRTAQSNIVSLQSQDLHELGRLYRQATSDLAQSRRDFPGHPVTVYLNDLVAQGHAAIYRDRRSSLSNLKSYFLVLLPRTFREAWPFMLASLIMFLIPAIVGWVVSVRDPNVGLSLMPELRPTINNMEKQREWWRDLNDANASGSVFILTNNIYVAIQALIGGLTFGLVTLYALYQNGLMLGIVAGSAHKMNFAGNLWDFVTAHAVVELSIIVLAGGAGLQLAWPMLQPGLVSRRAALYAAARKVFILLGAIIIFLIVAGFIEGFISPSNLPYPVKLGVAIGSGMVLYGYLFLCGRNASTINDADAESVLIVNAREKTAS